MITTKQVAEYIDQTEPSLVHFWQLVKTDPYSLIPYIQSEPDNLIKLFKADLLLTYIATHNSYHVDQSIASSIIKTIYKPLDYELKTALTIGIYTVNGKRSYRIYGYKLPDNTSLTHVTDPVKYLNQYLRFKLKEPGTTAVDLSIADDQMSFAVFQSWLDQNKPINSVQASEFLVKAFHFTNLKTQYVQAILDACHKPSIKLQRLVEDYDIYLTDTPYTAMTRREVRRLLNGHLVTKDIMDKRDSDYKPFVLGMHRKPTPTEWEVNSLISTAVAAYPAHSDYSKAVVEHLNHKDYDKVRAVVKQNILDSIQTYQQILKDL